MIVIIVYTTILTNGKCKVKDCVNGLIMCLKILIVVIKIELIRGNFVLIQSIINEIKATSFERKHAMMKMERKYNTMT